MAVAAALALALATATALPAEAGGVKQRQRHQQHRIFEGIRSGSLTPGEAARLEGEQFRIERFERRLRADGDFTCGDRARVHHRLDRSSRHIYRAKHNRLTTP